LNITEADSILDIGCSKGSALRQMLQFRFRRVDGLEISGKLCEVARSNFRKLKQNRVQIYNVDARYFSGYGDYNFFYLYHPFPEVVMKDVIACLCKQIGSKSVTLIYNNPVCSSLLEKAGFCKLKEYPDEWGNGIYVYSNRSTSSRTSGAPY
jgi:SAM-dependent methyltransferase